MAKLRINGDSSGYVDLEAPNAASSSTLDLDQVPQKNADTKFDTVLQVGSSSTMTNAYGAASGYVFDIKANSGTQSYMSIGMPADTLGSAGLVMGVDTSAIRIIGRDDKRQIFSTNNIDRMTIHSTTSGGGAVTTPYQPAMCAYPTGGTVASGDQNLLPFSNTLFNNGNHFNTTTKIFTAPVAGYYFASANVRWETGTFVQNSYIRLFISKNDGDYNSTRIHVINGSNEAWSNYMAMSCSGVAYCSAGDTLRVKGGMNSGTSEIHGESSFNVYLLG